MQTRILDHSANGSALVHASDWLAQTVTGSIGTTLAAVAIAWTGFAMLNGHLDMRRAGRVIIGCFILFGAPILAKGIMAAALGSHERSTRSNPAAINATPTAPPQFDPYAGASLPR
jgi:type IV secretory pathway VirB2 component (pilin)